MKAMNLRIAVATVCGVGLLMGILARRAQADPWDKRTILTVNQPIQITETLLQPGQYVLKLADSQSDRHIVEIFNSDQTHIINTVLAIPNYRLRPTGRSQFAFWETPPGYAKAMRAWFYPGDNFGQEFRYPKHLALLETAANTVTVTKTEAKVEEAPPPAPQEEVKQEEVEKPVEMAQAAPPPAPEPAPAPAAPAPPPETLPKTASPYPLIGLGGVFALGLYGLLRLKRVA